MGVKAMTQRHDTQQNRAWYSVSRLVRNRTVHGAGRLAVVVALLLPWGFVAGTPAASASGEASVPALSRGLVEGWAQRAGGAAAEASARWGGGFGVRPHTYQPVRSVAAGDGPTAVAVDQATHTVYVGNGNDNTVSVINAATCNAHVSSGCDQVPASVAVGEGPVFDAVNQVTDTIYVVALGSNTVSVIDGATCNASVTTGCSKPPVTVTVGDGPDGIAIDPATDTIYVANSGPGGDGTGDTVSVISGATCDGQVTSGCGRTPPTITVGLAPTVPAFNPVTRTLYVPDGNPGAEGLISVVNTKTCNAGVTSGCGQTPPTVSVGFNTFPAAVAVDPATNTAYATAFGPSLGSVYVIDGRRCDATVTSGCGQSPPTVTVGSGPTDVVVNPRTHDVLVVNQEDSTVSVIDGTRCNAFRTSGCDQHAPVATTGFSPGSFLDVDLATDTVYVAVAANVSVLDGAACTLTHQAGCRHAVPTTTVGNAPQGTAVNPLTDTVYVGDRDDNRLSVINGATCNAHVSFGCDQAWPTVATGPTPEAVAIDEKTGTVYTANTDPDNDYLGSTVSVIDGNTCNAHDHAGCGAAPATVEVGNGPATLAINEVTHTIYVANKVDGTVSVIDITHCHAGDTSGCAAAPQTITVGTSPQGVAIDEATDTVYVSNFGDADVSVIDGATCNATVTTGCAQTPVTVPAGNGARGEAFDPETRTLYVENTTDATVSVISTAVCNASTTLDCNRISPVMTTGGDPFRGVALDKVNHTLFLGSAAQSAVDAFDVSTCNAEVVSGCNQTADAIPTGGWPTFVAVNPLTGTVYAPDNVDGQVSYFSANTH
jgi:DNA-binding beta-propeller fold protein YncE